jgi:hypothetical protein
VWLPYYCLAGVSALSSAQITALEYIPLVWQLLIVLGVGPDEPTAVGGVILPHDVRLKVVRALYSLVTLREALWKRTHTEEDVKQLSDVRVPQMLKLFKEAFGDSIKSGCAFIKFHMTKHVPGDILRFGSLRHQDSGQGENLHYTTIKRAFRMTAKEGTKCSTSYPRQLCTPVPCAHW